MLLFCRDFFSHLGDFLYPQVCHFCSNTLGSKEKKFCFPCMEGMQFLSVEGRCGRCLGYIEEDSIFYCKNCEGKPHFLTKLSAAFVYEGLPSYLWKQMQKEEGKTFLPLIASFLVMHMMKQGYPIPDFVTAVPKRSIWGFPKKEAVHFLAEQVAENLNVPYVPLLKAERYFSQKGKTKKERELLSSQIFSWKQDTYLAGETILLVEDMLVTGSTMQAMAEKIQEGMPKEVYGIAFCCAR